MRGLVQAVPSRRRAGPVLVCEAALESWDPDTACGEREGARHKIQISILQPVFETVKLTPICPPGLL